MNSSASFRLQQEPPTCRAESSQEISGDLRQSSGGRHFSNRILSVKSFVYNTKTQASFFSVVKFGNVCVEDFQGKFWKI